MPAKVDPMVFRKGEKVWCRKDFPYGGKRFKAGDLFPWRRLSVSLGKIRAMFQSRHLSHNPPGDEAPDKDELEPQSAVTLKRLGGGWYDLYREGKKLNASPIHGKSEAKKWAEENL